MWKSICVILAAFGAVNWAVLAMHDTDAVVALLGDDRTVGTDALRLVVAFAGITSVVLLLKSADTKKK